MESPADSVAADSHSDAPAANRLVIRIDLGPDASNRAPERPRTTRGALLPILGAVAIALVWVGIKSFSAERASTPTIAPASPDVAAHVEQPPPEPPPPPSIHEVIPNVPQGALDTIRGTVRVTIRVNVGKDGKIVRAITEEPGPSRYFERLALDASRKWTFEPAASAEERIRLVRFNFRRDGTTATAETLQ